MIRFLCSGWRLVEIDEAEATTSLTAAFEHHFGHRPDFGPEGDVVTGHHEPGSTSRERVMTVVRCSNEDAVRQAVRLLRVRHDLDRVHFRSASAEFDCDFDWEATSDPPSYDPGAVSAWPAQEAPIRDALVVEFVGQPGKFVSGLVPHSVHAARKATTSVTEALTFADPASAWRWIEKLERDDIRPVYRSAALAMADQTAMDAWASTQNRMR